MFGKNRNDDDIINDIKFVIQDLLPNLAQLAKVSTKNLLKQVIQRVEGLRDVSLETIEIWLKMAWQVEEYHCRNYSLEEALKWFKARLPPEAVEGVLLKMSSSRQGNIVLHHCFLDENQNPLLNGDYPHLIVTTREIDEKLTRQFGDKDMILFK